MNRKNNISRRTRPVRAKAQVPAAEPEEKGVTMPMIQLTPMLSAGTTVEGSSAASASVPFIQAKAGSETTVPGAIAKQVENSRDGGTPMDRETKTFMEHRFNSDFSEVNIHTGEASAALNRSLNAKAFTVGNDIYFNEGQYNPQSNSGKHLLAHELAHTLQQGNGQTKKIARKVDEASVQAEYDKWADANKKTKDKTNKDFPWDAWDFIRPQIMNDVMEPHPKPTDKAGLEKWNDSYTKAEIVGNWIYQLASSTKSDEVKKDAISKISMIADGMANAGLIGKAMTQAGHTDDEHKTIVYTTILKNPSQASSSELETIFNFFTGLQTDPEKVDFIKTLCYTNGNTLQMMSADRIKAMFKVMIAKYGSHAKVVQAMATVLIFNMAVRTSVADDMMSSTLGTPDILFKILSHPAFKDPEYEGAVLLNNPNNDIDKDTEKHWKDDMPFAFKYKQKYYVKFLIDMAAKNAVVIAQPAGYTATQLRTWLDANTEKIGQAAAKEYAGNNNGMFELYRNITDIFFYHAEKDITPDNEGKLGKLGVAGRPDKLRIEADCDVFATYGMRLFNSGGYEPIGYIGLYPIGAYIGHTARDAHAAALIRKNGAYFVINNKSLLDTGITEVKPNEKKEDAMKEMKTKAIDDTYGDPKPAKWDIYYADAEVNGRLPADFLQKPAKYQRNDL